MAEFKLSASLVAHEDDVRSVCFPSSKAVISASRDGTVRRWELVTDTPPIFDPTISSHVNSFVNSVAYLRPNPQFPDGLIISGGNDVVIDVRRPSKSQGEDADGLLLGHSKNVCALDVDPAGKFIVSGSWDSEARVFSVGNWECETVLRGHQGGVWAVLVFNSETIITGCADQQIRIFHKSGKLLTTFAGSLQPIRALCLIPKDHPSGADFASASNDGVICLWKLSGAKVAELHGHDNFIYSLASLPSGELVSSGEDRTLRIWKGTECIQTITHPAISVWGVAVCTETGDIVSGASDRIVRVFSRSPDREADAETSRQFDEAVKSSSIPQEQMGDINKEEYPGPEFLTQKSGTREGQVQMIRELNGSVTAHTWSASRQEWINVGTVVGGAGSNGVKTEYKGQDYDYVFDVDIEDNKPPLKLPYNLSQNPYEAATKFLENNKLPISYLDTVANFITENCKGASLGSPSNGPASAGSDPWGSESRYRPGEDSLPSPLPKYIPQKNYLSILPASLPRMYKKAEEINQALISGGKKDVSLNPAEMSELQNICKLLESASGASASSTIEKGLDGSQIELVVKIATKWPYAERMVGLDFLRLLAVAPSTARYGIGNSTSGNLIRQFEIGCMPENDQAPAENLIMLAIRGFGNLFESEIGRELAIFEIEKIKTLVTNAVSASNNRNILIAATTLYINYAVLYHYTPAKVNFDDILAFLESLNHILTSASDEEVISRAMVALGTIISLGNEAKSAAKDVYTMQSSIDTAVKKLATPRIRNIAKEVSDLLKR
ncbi:hypothetical protein B7494_g2464 [Chlorociboria aeruginascens]|nr:hypothetical protein B7494_g2464 [Chlorociboria aeruginascens]